MYYYMLIYYTQLFWVFENHVIGRCQGLFPPILSSAEKSPGNEVEIWPDLNDKEEGMRKIEKFASGSA